MKEQKLAFSLFFSDVKKIKLDGKNIKVIKMDYFIEKVKSLMYLTEARKESLMKSLAFTEHEDFVKLRELADFFKIHNIGTKLYDESIEEIPLNYEELDDMSMMLMLALTKHIDKNDISIYQLFKGFIRDIDCNENIIEVINTKDFFNIMNKIEIMNNSEPYGNLEKFLKLNENSDELDFDKIKKLLQIIDNDDELKETIQKKYKDLIIENEPEENNKFEEDGIRNESNEDI